MKKSLQSTVLLIALFLLAAGPAAAADIVKCTECGMSCDVNAKFTARIVQGDQTHYFCDIGDLFTYLNRKKPTVTRIEVKDYPTGEWMDARAAFYVHAEKKFKTPMGWGIASFRDRNKAAEFGATMDFDGTAKAVK